MQNIGICCFCGDECNQASQSCGICMRQRTFLCYQEKKKEIECVIIPGKEFKSWGEPVWIGDPYSLFEGDVWDKVCYNTIDSGYAIIENTPKPLFFWSVGIDEFEIQRGVEEKWEDVWSCGIMCIIPQSTFEKLGGNNDTNLIEDVGCDGKVVNNEMFWDSVIFRRKV